jgi:formylglycine-generating enzyme required for sulfatase activity
MVMMYVPAGNFMMGSSDGGDEKKPVHTVYLDAYWIDRTEVTNAMYAKCVADGVCRDATSSDHSFNKVDHPATYIKWDDAQTYCAWAEAHLPAEAEWEKAARGTDGRKFPWGNDDPNSKLLNYSSLVGDTTPVGSYPSGASPYGVFDMAGNAWEWTSDWFDKPSLDSYHVVKGGGYNGMLEHYFHVFFRQPGFELEKNWPFSLGFRCANTATP